MRPTTVVAAKAFAKDEQFQEHAHLLQNYRRAPVTFVRGEGCELIDDHGVRYLDFMAGIAVCALGHAHPVITEAITKQAAILVQASNLYYHEPAGTLANELARRSGLVQARSRLKNEIHAVLIRRLITPPTSVTCSARPAGTG